MARRCARLQAGGTIQAAAAPHPVRPRYRWALASPAKPWRPSRGRAPRCGERSCCWRPARRCGGARLRRASRTQSRGTRSSRSSLWAAPATPSTWWRWPAGWRRGAGASMGSQGRTQLLSVRTPGTRGPTVCPQARRDGRHPGGRPRAHRSRRVAPGRPGGAHGAAARGRASIHARWTGLRHGLGAAAETSAASDRLAAAHARSLPRHRPARRRLARRDTTGFVATVGHLGGRHTAVDMVRRLSRMPYALARSCERILANETLLRVRPAQSSRPPPCGQAAAAARRPRHRARGRRGAAFQRRGRPRPRALCTAPAQNARAAPRPCRRPPPELAVPRLGAHVRLPAADRGRVHLPARARAGAAADARAGPAPGQHANVCAAGGRQRARAR
jgi:hypothetical protein